MSEAKQCLVCEKGADEAPLITFDYRGRTLWICPQDLPVLIHDPARLAAKLPGAETLKRPDCAH